MVTEFVVIADVTTLLTAGFFRSAGKAESLTPKKVNRYTTRSNLCLNFLTSVKLAQKGVVKSLDRRIGGDGTSTKGVT